MSSHRNENNRSNEMVCIFLMYDLWHLVIMVSLCICSSKCKHHISKAGVELLSKRSKDFPCPFTGCRAKWSMNDVSRDREFDILVERHFRLREASGSSSSQHCAVPLELDDDE